MALNVLYEDNHLIIINKPSGALVQADKTGDEPLSDTVKKYIKKKYNKPGEVFLGVVHRIDRPVSGVLIFARTSKALERMNALFKDKKVQKTYWAVVHKAPQPEQGRLEGHIIKDARLLKAFVFHQPQKESKACALDYRVISSSDRHHLLEVKPMTGRYHQIRAQLSSIGCPIRGDLKYGAPRSNANGGIHLHARKVEFEHPVTKEWMVVKAPVPQEDAVWGLFAGQDD